MNKKILVGAVIIIVLAGGAWFFSQKTTPATAPSNNVAQGLPSLETLKNATYQLSDGSFHALANGEYYFVTEQGKVGAEVTINNSLILDTKNIAYGNLGDAWKNIAIVIVGENNGGNGTSVTLQVMQGSSAKFVASFPLGDRPAIHSVSIGTLDVTYNSPNEHYYFPIINIDMTHGVSDPKQFQEYGVDKRGQRETIQLIINDKNQLEYRPSTAG